MLYFLTKGMCIVSIFDFILRVYLLKAEASAGDSFEPPASLGERIS
ncbi:MAG: hypothetical protein KJO98_01730 [Rhodothermia bacterium]|nr:hypothetical protein [Rhodothermia bacterium]